MSSNTDLHQQCQHDLLIGLTRQRDLPTLDLALHAALCEIAGRLDVVLLCLWDAKHQAWQPSEGRVSQLDKNRLPAGLECNMSLLHNALCDGSHYSFFPVTHNERPVAAIAAFCELSEKQLELFDILLAIYANQRFILERNMRDALTGLLNRQAFDERMEQIFTQLSRNQRRADHEEHEQWTLALLDIDHFKQINDNYGHLYGDEVLVLFARLLRQSFRDEDLVFRYGGEEFAVLLRNVDDGQAHAICERLRAHVEAHPFPQVKHISVSIGHAPLHIATAPSTLIDAADRALYQAKNSGRNTVRAYTRLVAEGQLRPVTGLSSEIELF